MRVVRLALAVVALEAAVSVTAAEAAGTAGAAGAEALRDLVPDVLRELPLSVLGACFGSVPVSPGQELAPAKVRAAPSLSWAAEPGDLFTVCMTDPDAPTRANATSGEFLHWLVVNAPGGAASGGNAGGGDVLAEYVGSGPPLGTGLHRYVLLVFRQSGRLSVSDEPRRNTLLSRIRFSIQRFADTHGLQLPAAAATYYQAQWDESVPELHRQLAAHLSTPPPAPGH